MEISKYKGTNMSAEQIGRRRAKLTIAQVRSILKIDKEVPAWKVAQEYGVSPETIRRIRQRKGWKNLDY
jgi:LysM repeat protein